MEDMLTIVSWRFALMLGSTTLIKETGPKKLVRSNWAWTVPRTP